ncbi:MAG: methyltransferase domain-containing protein [Thermoleophilia bacterium]
MNAHEWGTAPDFVGPRHELRESLLLDLVAEAQPGPRMLNVGAGQGSFSRLLEARGFAVTSVEASPAAVDVLRRRTTGEVVEGDAAALPFADGTFDAVILGEVLEHLDDDVAALREAQRVLLPEGLVAASVPRNPAWFSASDRWAGHVRRYTREALLGAFQDADLTIERCVAWGFPVSALYHRTVYERHIDRRGAATATKRQRPALALLRVVLQVDRLFLGHEHGALGYLVLARSP